MFLWSMKAADFSFERILMKYYELPVTVLIVNDCDHLTTVSFVTFTSITRIARKISVMFLLPSMNPYIFKKLN
jgi:hypothetical protein